MQKWLIGDGVELIEEIKEIKGFKHRLMLVRLFIRVCTVVYDPVQYFDKVILAV